MAEDICKVCCHKHSLRRLDLSLKISRSVATSPAEDRPKDLLKKYPAVSRFQMLKSLVWQLSHLQKLQLARINLDQNLFHSNINSCEYPNLSIKASLCCTSRDLVEDTSGIPVQRTVTADGFDEEEVCLWQIGKGGEER